LLHRENTRLDALSLERDRSLWHRITRAQAVQLCRSHRVAVLFQTAGQDAASWFGPESRFFRSDSPYSYDSLRYFLQIGATAGTGWGKSAGMPNKPAASVELEPLEFEDQATGEMRSLGSPAAKTPKTPGGTNPSDLADLSKQSGTTGLGAAGLGVAGLGASGSGVLDLANPGSGAPGSDVPELGDIADLPTLKDGFAIPELPENAALASQVPKAKHPIEIKLIGLDEKPMKDVPFRLSLPDGTVKEGKSDSDGLISFPDNEVKGEMELVLTEFAGQGT
jgi:hypothetical protein